jgi:hypothetical protein
LAAERKKNFLINPPAWNSKAKDVFLDALQFQQKIPPTAEINPKKNSKYAKKSAEHPPAN